MTSQELQEQIYDLIKQKGSVSTLGLACYFADVSGMDVSWAVHSLIESDKLERFEGQGNGVIFFTIKNDAK